jgi:hypothetical protein
MPVNDSIATKQFMVMCALRYAIGRQTYITGMVTEEIQRIWNDLNADEQNAIEIDVRHELKDGKSADGDLIKLATFITAKRAEPPVPPTRF